MISDALIFIFQKLWTRSMYHKHFKFFTLRIEEEEEEEEI
jgi:hypothetical protein